MIENAQRPICGADRAQSPGVLVNRADTAGYVLIVEDDEGVADVIVTILADAGIEAVCARSGEAALRQARARTPGLVLLDLSVAGAHPEDLVAAYRSGTGATAPLVVVSGHPHGRVLAAGIGAHAYLEKPFDLMVLLDTVEAALGR